jgi:hypothetical protein
MASEEVVEVAVRRHALTNSQPFSAVLDGILSSISRPDIGQLIRKRGASTSYEEFRSLVSRAQGGSSLMRFVQLDLDTAFTHDPQARGHAGRRLVRLIAGNPVTMGEMTRHVPDSGSYAPITILLEEMRDGETRVAYDTVASAIAAYRDAAASRVAEQLDTEVLTLLRKVTGARSAASWPPGGDERRRSFNEEFC